MSKKQAGFPHSLSSLFFVSHCSKPGRLVGLIMLNILWTRHAGSLLPGRLLFAGAPENLFAAVIIVILVTAGLRHKVHKFMMTGPESDWDQETRNSHSRCYPWHRFGNVRIINVTEWLKYIYINIHSIYMLSYDAVRSPHIIISNWQESSQSGRSLPVVKCILSSLFWWKAKVFSMLLLPLEVKCLTVGRWTIQSWLIEWPSELETRVHQDRLGIGINSRSFKLPLNWPALYCPTDISPYIYI